MSINQKDNPGKSGEENISGGNFGNASNSSPNIRENDQSTQNQLLDEKAEKYIRESGNIEDMPDPQEQQDADEILKKEYNNKAWIKDETRKRLSLLIIHITKIKTEKSQGSFPQPSLF